MTRKKAAAKTNQHEPPSQQCLKLFNDEKLYQDVKFVEFIASYFVNDSGFVPEDAPANIRKAAHFLHAVKSLLEGNADARQLLLLLQLSTERIIHSLTLEPTFAELSGRYRQVLKARRGRSRSGKKRRGKSKLANHDTLITKLFNESHGGGKKPLRRGWRKCMLEKLAAERIYVDGDRLTSRLKTLELMPVDRKK